MVIAAISIENEKPLFNSYILTYRGPKNGYIRINPEQTIKMKFHPDFFDQNKAVYYFSITGTPGNYKFTELGLFRNTGYVQSTRSANIDFDFEIEKGKVKYVGEIYFNYKKQLILLNDEKERDIPKLKSLFPNLPIE